jgi:hypothetical protein
VSQQIHNVYHYNPATKRKTIIYRVLVQRSRKHGRPRNVGKRTRIKRLPLPT